MRATAASFKGRARALKVELTGSLPTWEFYRDWAELQYLQVLIELTGGDFAAACQLAGFSRSRLYAVLKKHNIAMPVKESTLG